MTGCSTIWHYTRDEALDRKEPNTPILVKEPIGISLVMPVILAIHEGLGN